jgi:hypothetical protein
MQIVLKWVRRLDYLDKCYTVVNVPDIENKIKKPQSGEYDTIIADKKGDLIEIEEIVHT